MYDCRTESTTSTLHSLKRASFNAENQITQMDGGAAVYAYDAEGRRAPHEKKPENIVEVGTEEEGAASPVQIGKRRFRPA